MTLTTRWEDIDWGKISVRVFRLQKQIYTASRCGDVKKVRKLQKLLRMSWSAKALAIRRVTQDNQGKKTAGIDGIKALTPKERFELISNLKINGKSSPTRRVWIPKPGKDEKRPLGIPTMVDRAKQALIMLTLEPEWEARFEPNSYGFRPGRCSQDAISHIKNVIQAKAKFVLDADIAKCFDRINHSKLLDKLDTQGRVRQQIKSWLKAGVLDKRVFERTERGTPQGGVLSPLLANIALDGIEEKLNQYALTLNHLRYPCGKKYTKKDRIKSLTYIRYADDFIVLHEDKMVIKHCKQLITEWLAAWGLELKPSKTRIAHILKAELSDDGIAGFNFLGFNIRQYKRGKHKSDFNSNRIKPEPLGFDTLIIPSKEKVKLHYSRCAKIIDQHKTKSQTDLINNLNPVIRGWINYYRFSDIKTFGITSKLDQLIFNKLRSWGRYRTGSTKTAYQKYWTTQGNKNWVFANRQGDSNPLRLFTHGEVECSSINYVKVKGESSPYDGRVKYWSTRRGEYPETPKRLALLLKTQKGKCKLCGLYFREDSLIEIDHIIPKAVGGKDKYDNLQALHRHCHDVKTKSDMILINQHGHKQFMQRLYKEWEKIDYIWVDDIPVVLGSKSRCKR
ncbi:MAG: group II intron reverse transcriptase/maturase [Prochloraceae cyanobacterium]|nr:group II intron reverse transcriptase/maturase [Prochloraceae cyanobacterium]